MVTRNKKLTRKKALQASNYNKLNSTNNTNELGRGFFFQLSENSAKLENSA